MFAVAVVGVVEALPQTRAANHIGGQLLRAGTSPAANYAEAQDAESGRDFVHELKVALKERKESRVWRRIILSKHLIPADGLGPVLNEGDELIRILGKSVVTAGTNAGKRPCRPFGKGTDCSLFIDDVSVQELPAD